MATQKNLILNKIWKKSLIKKPYRAYLWPLPSPSTISKTEITLSSQAGFGGEKNVKFCFKQEVITTGMTRNILQLNSLIYVSGYFSNMFIFTSSLTKLFDFISSLHDLLS